MQKQIWEPCCLLLSDIKDGKMMPFFPLIGEGVGKKMFLENKYFIYVNMEWIYHLKWLIIKWSFKFLSFNFQYIYIDSYNSHKQKLSDFLNNF